MLRNNAPEGYIVEMDERREGETAISSTRRLETSRSRQKKYLYKSLKVSDSSSLVCYTARSSP